MWDICTSVLSMAYGVKLPEQQLHELKTWLAGAKDLVFVV